MKFKFHNFLNVSFSHIIQLFNLKRNKIIARYNQKNNANLFFKPKQKKAADTSPAASVI
jgi:hypothetical protein